MMNGRNNGKKLMAVRIVAHSFEIVRTIQLGPYTMTTSVGNFCYQAISNIFEEVRHANNFDFHRSTS